MSDFPNPLSPDTSKDSTEFGLRFMQTAYDKWSNGTGESASQRKNRFEYNRLYASGKQPMEEFKDRLDLDGEMSVINLSFDPLAIAPPFIYRLTDRYMQRFEKIQCNAIDPVSQSKKEKAKNDALFKLKEKNKIVELQKASGVELEEFSEDDPQTEEELNIQFGFTYKQREEVIMEQGIDLVLYDNNWPDVIKKRILYDGITCGIAQVRPYIDANGRIKATLTKPEYIISSYTEWDDFRDCQYQGAVIELSISDIRLKYPGKISEEKLWELANSQRGLNGNTTHLDAWNQDYNNGIARPYDSFRVQTVQLSLKTLYNLKYEVNKDRFDKEILDPVTKFKEGKEYLKSNPYEVEYEGVLIIGTKYLLKWGLAKNQIKPEKNLTEVILPWVTYMYNNNKMTNTPLIETMIPSIKQMQLIHLQQQKIIAAAAPDGYDVDISTASDITLGQGMENLSPYDLYKIYKQTGVKYFKRIEDDGEGMRQAPIQANSVPFSPKLEQLMNQWNQEYDILSKIVGSNNLDQGHITNQAVGNQTLKDARQIGESASNYLYDMYLNMLTRSAKIIMMRLWDILVYGKKDGIKYYDGYRAALGEARVDYIKIEASDDFEKTQFDVKVQAVIDDQEQQMFEQNAQIVLSGDPSMLPDISQARQLAKTNIKYANHFLMSQYKKRRKEAIEESRINAQANTEQAIAAANAKTEGEKQVLILKSELAKKEKDQELNQLQVQESVKYASILKVELMKSILSQEGKGVQDLPEFIFQGIELSDANTKQLIMAEMQKTQEEAEAKAQQQLQMQQQTQMEEEMPANPDQQMVA